MKALRTFLPAETYHFLLLLQATICTYKAYIRNTQYFLLHFSAVDRDIHWTTTTTCKIGHPMKTVNFLNILCVCRLLVLIVSIILHYTEWTKSKQITSF